MIAEFYGTYASFFLSALLGFGFGALYDVFRILRISRLPYVRPSGRFYELISIPQSLERRGRGFIKLCRLSNTAIVFIEDMLFWVIASICQVLFIYHVNGGAIRIYFLIFSFLCASAYFMTVGRLTAYLSVRIIFLIRCLLYWAFCIIIYPIRIILLIISRIALRIAEVTVIPVANAVKNRIEVEYSQKRILSILEQSKKGFFEYGSNKEKKYYS